MEFRIFQVDAFTDHIFGGNPACVVPMENWQEDQVLLNIAKENAVAETAFFIPKDQDYHLRWFTPDIEMDLCGHATLATAHVIFKHLNAQTDVINFHSASGILTVIKKDEGYSLDFPSRKPVEADLPEIVSKSLSKQPSLVLKARDYVLVYESEEDIKNLKIDRNIIDQINLDPGGMIITAKGKTVDFVSRFFTPQSTIFEDPVTGSAHCSLVPYWSERLNKTELSALQLSERGGVLHCVNTDERVFISGNAKTYLTGNIVINSSC